MVDEKWSTCTHLRQEYCKDTSCETCGGTGSYFCSEDSVRYPCMETFEKSTGRKVREEITGEAVSGERLLCVYTRWRYVDDGTIVPDSDTG